MKQLKIYAHKCIKRLVRNIESYHHIDDPEVLHSIRLEIKKIKSVLNLLQYGVSKCDGHRLYIPFRTIFRKANEIRQPEVIYRLLLQSQIDAVTDSQIPNANQEERLKHAFRTDAPEFVKKVLAQEKKLKKYLGAITKQKAVKYLDKRRRQVKRQLYPTLKITTLHKTRKIIKEIIFLQWVDKHKKSTSFFEQIEKSIGEWHDKQVLLNVLNDNLHREQASILNATCVDDLKDLKMAIRAHYRESKEH